MKEWELETPAESLQILIRIKKKKRKKSDYNNLLEFVNVEMKKISWSLLQAKIKYWIVV